MPHSDALADLGGVAVAVTAPGGTHACPECPDGLLFHRYSDGGRLEGVVCCFCDFTETLEEAPNAE